MKQILGESELEYIQRLQYFAERVPADVEMKLDAKVLLKLINVYLDKPVTCHPVEV